MRQRRLQDAYRGGVHVQHPPASTRSHPLTLPLTLTAEPGVVAAGPAVAGGAEDVAVAAAVARKRREEGLRRARLCHDAPYRQAEADGHTGGGGGALGEGGGCGSEASRARVATGRGRGRGRGRGGRRSGCVM